MKLVPRQHWTIWSHWLIWHGRRRCFARKPDCQQCEVFNLCPSGKIYLRTGEARRGWPNEYCHRVVRFCDLFRCLDAFLADALEFTFEFL